MAGRTRRILKNKGKRQKEVMRHCLRCENKFVAVGKFNRICTACKQLNCYKWTV